MADVNTLKARQTMLQKKADLILATAERETRALTDAEKTDLTALEQQIDGLTAQIDRTESTASFNAELDRITGGQGTRGARGSTAPLDGLTPRGTCGDLVARAAAFSDFIRSGGHRASGAWRSPAVDVPYASMFATTLTEDPASGGKLVIPDYRPGIIPTATRPIVVMDLLMPGTTESNAVVYMQETAFTNAATPVAEGGTKPESALTFIQVSEPVLKIAHWLPTTEELLEDVPAIAAYIDGRLRTGVQLAEDDQLLNGNGTAPNFRGLLNRSGLATTVVQGAGENVPDAILRQIGVITTTAMTAPTGIIMNPADWFGVAPLKGTDGQYIGRSPFDAPIAPTLWGLPCSITSAIAPKTALVGAFATQAQFFRRGGLRVEASNSHQDYFVKNLVAIRAEERGSLCVYRPGSFGKVTLL